MGRSDNDPASGRKYAGDLASDPASDSDRYLFYHPDKISACPDVPGYADALEGEARDVLRLRPGITGPASLKYANEEEILALVDDPQRYNDEVIFPDKVRINLEYYHNHTFMGDLRLIFATIFRSYESAELPKLK